MKVYKKTSHVLRKGGGCGGCSSWQCWECQLPRCWGVDIGHGDGGGNIIGAIINHVNCRCCPFVIQVHVWAVVRLSIP